MTTKPKAKKFRIRRGSPLSGDGVPAPNMDRAEASDPVENIAAEPTQPEENDQTAPPGTEQAISEIRKEGLTGRQLRMARRIAQRHGIAVTSDYDAVRQLRAKGIDPFRRANMLELVVADEAQMVGSDQQLPQTMAPSDQNLPATMALAEGQRAREIQNIQRDITRRRRRKLTLLVTRLCFFVFLPTILAGYYYYAVATPLYATKSEFVIQQAEPAGIAPGAGSLFSGTGFATSQDSIAVQSFLQSRAAMLRLDNEHAFKAHFSAPHLDAITRLEDDASNEQAYKLYTRYVRISYDPTEGIIKMEVSATDPESSARFSEALVAYAEEYVDGLSQRKREDQMAGARESYEESELKVQEAQQNVIDLQEKYDVLSTDVEISLLTQRIASLEGQLTQEELSLAELMANPRPNQARVDPVRNRIETLQRNIAELRAQLTHGGSEGGVSLARVSSELAVAQADLETRTLMLQQALQTLVAARMEANGQTRFLETGVRPVAPDEPTYPRAFENTVLAFFIFAGIYLMASLTASILREQVSS